MGLKDICFVVLLFVVLAVSAAVMSFAITRLVQKKKFNKEMQLAAVIAAAVAVYTETPTSNFKVVSFKKVNKFKAWNT